MKLLYLLAFAGLAATPVAAKVLYPHLHLHRMLMMQGQTARGGPAQGGQSAFAAISEIVGVLQRDPATDWSKVDIGALQAHLADMDKVMLHSTATTEAIPGGARITVNGDGEAIAPVQRMMGDPTPFLAAATGYSVDAAKTGSGAQWTVVSTTPGDDVKIRALGFYGLLTIGAHHELRHLAIARGDMVH